MMRKSSIQAAEKPQDRVRLAGEAETAEYIGDLLAQLERLARLQGLVQLQYLLAGCREEAQKIASAGGNV